MEMITALADVLETVDLQPEYLAAMNRIMSALQYPVAPDGTIVDTSFTSAVSAYHLARCGFDLVNDPLIKKRAVSGPGIIVGACDWVPPDESTDPVVYRSPLDDLDNMTMGQIDALPEPLRSQARERLGLPHDKPGWQQKPAINIEDAPDVSDGAEWIRE